MDLGELISHIKWAEGTGPRDNKGNYFIYRDYLNNETVGYGHLVSRGFDPEVIELQLAKDIEGALRDARKIDYFDSLDPVRACAVVDLVFNMGLPKLKRFVNFHAAMRIKDYKLASMEIKNSRYYTQTGRRARKICDAIKTGAWNSESGETEGDDKNDPEPVGISTLGIFIWFSIGAFVQYLLLK